MKKSFTYVRVAHKEKDNADGFIYLHHFGTGWEELIFPTHEAAATFKTKQGI